MAPIGGPPQSSDNSLGRWKVVSPRAADNERIDADLARAYAGLSGEKP